MRVEVSHRSPSFESGFACFSIFCVFSTFSTLMIKVPAQQAEASGLRLDFYPVMSHLRAA